LPFRFLCSCVPPNCCGLVFMPITMVLVFVLNIVVLWSYTTFLITFVFYCICFWWILIIGGHQPCYLAPLCLLFSPCLLFSLLLRPCCAIFEIHAPILVPIYLLVYLKILVKFIPTSLTTTQVQVVANCVFMHFSTTFWVIQFVAILTSINFLNFWSSFSFHLPSWFP
jgi:hypothetical protein